MKPRDSILYDKMTVSLCIVGYRGVAHVCMVVGCGYTVTALLI